MAETVESNAPEIKSPEKPAVSFSIWPPTDRTRDAVTNRLVETLSAPSVLSKRYGTIPHDDALATARRIEEEAFAAAAASASTDDDGIEILQVYSKEISKRMLEAVKSRSAPPAPAEGTANDASEEASGEAAGNTPVYQHWIPPKDGIFKVNFDGAIFKDSSCSGLGVIIRDHKGECVAALSQNVHQHVSAEFIKTSAARRAVNFAMESGFWSIHIEGDERNVVQVLKADDDENMAAIGGVIEETRSLLSQISCVDISWTSRNCNGAARSLAEFARQVDDYIVWLEEVPEFVNLDVVDDFSNQ